VGAVRHFGFLSARNRERYFEHQPQEIDRTGDRGDLAVALGATLYTPATRADLDKAVERQTARGATSMVLCLEDAIPDDLVDAAEKNLVEAVTAMHEDGTDLPLLFVRVRRPDQLLDVARRLGPAAAALSGFVLPKFGPANGEEYFAALTEAESVSGTRLLAMPVMESPEVTHEETRQDTLCWAQDTLGRHREQVLAVRIGATDLSAVYGLRRSPDLTVYDVRVVAQVITDIVNRLGRADGTGFVITGPVWEYFDGGERIFKPRLRETLFERHHAEDLRRQLISRDMDGLIREVELDKVNGLTGKTVIHPSHVLAVNALQVVTHEEHADAIDILGSLGQGGVAASGYGNKMNESKPHTAWAQRTATRARMFGVSAPDVSFVEILAASLLS
jgi:citrate lyase beta subunit